MGISPVELIEHIAVFSIALVFGLRNLARAWKIFGWAAILIAILTGVEGASGVFALATHGVSRIAHRWLDHGLMILLWWMNVAGLGLGLASIRTRPTTTIGTGILVITLFFLMMLESVMGYLPGADAFGGPAGEESRNRFYVLHCVVLPLALGLCLSAVVVLTRSWSKRVNRNGHRRPVEFGNPDNSYRSPE
ncbi:MAG TPA: hypothetical protein VF306_03370 [Pirellulales bacterium]